MPNIVFRIRCLTLVAMVLGCSCIGGLFKQALAEQPKLNVVLILIDDLGWRDLGCYGSEYYQTPHIDALAAEGMRLTNGYAACNVCSPTRAAIMTGKSPARLLLTQWLPSGRWNATERQLREGRYLSNLPLEEVTVAEALREAGYRTAFMGKWHLGTATYYYPEHQGFDLNVAGRDYGAPGSYFYPFEGSWKIPTTGKQLFKESPLPGTEGDYLPDRLSDEAVAFIRDNADHPFFLMLSHYAVHTPLQGKPDIVARYEQLPAEQRQGKPHYAAMVESIDESVGKVTSTLRQLNLDERTLIVFTSDNGGFAGATDNTPLRANKGSNYEGGIRVPVIIKWPGHTPAGSVSDEPVISMDLYPTILAATGQPLRPYQHLDGVDLSPVLTGKDQLDRDAIYWHYPHYNQHPESFPSGVVRSGDWKLIEHYETGQVSLYNLADDISEANDLAQTNARQAAILQGKLARWRSDVGADPMRVNPQYRTAAVQAPVKVEPDLVYAKVGDHELKLDLHVPTGHRKPPLVVWIHGGGWRGGSRKNPKLLELTKHGYAIASISYRFSDQAIFPAQIHDCKAAIRWLRGHADQYGYDADSITVAGSSAGGHLALLVGVSADVDAMEGSIGEHLDQSSRVQAVVDYFGPSDFVLRGKTQPDRAYTEKSGSFAMLGGLRDGQLNPEIESLASPATYVTVDDPPLLVFHGDNDQTVLVDQSQRITELYRRAGLSAQLVVLPGAGHGGKQFFQGQHFRTLLKFLSR